MSQILITDMFNRNVTLAVTKGNHRRNEAGEKRQQQQKGLDVTPMRSSEGSHAIRGPEQTKPCTETMHSRPFHADQSRVVHRSESARPQFYFKTPASKARRSALATEGYYCTASQLD